MTQAPEFAKIVVPGPVRDPLAYNIPQSLRSRIQPGSRVLIPLQKRIVTGIVLELIEDTSLPTKAIIDQLDDRPILDQQLLQLAAWTAQYYLASLGEVLGTMLPPHSRRRSSKRIVRRRRVDIAVQDELAKGILGELDRRGGTLTITTLKKKFPRETLDRSLSRLEAVGAIALEAHIPQRRGSFTTISDPTEHRSHPRPAKLALTPGQESAYQTILDRVNAGGFETFLLHGVTGSGKTEVYIRAMERVRQIGRRSLILIPEISLTPQLLDRLVGRFPGIGLLHSGLTGAERWAQWLRISRGEFPVVVGARSAVFAPIPELGLIIVDEEHDASYKQEEGLRYNGRDLAIVRGRLLNCPVVLGSATPALETYENCRRARYRLLEITERVEQRPLPSIETIDLRKQVGSAPMNEHKTGPKKFSDRPLISNYLADALAENLQAGRQSLIFLNRRGFANFVQCNLCGYVWRCPYCSVTLTLHRRHHQISCHHCGYRRPHDNICPDCQNVSLTAVGSGTERVEEVLGQLLPGARLARMDRDTTSRRGSQENIIRRWERGQIDVLIGTQMVTKGHDVSGVTLVGAILADLSLNLPDFRAAERTFQVLSQVAGRAGRGENLGKVIIQTYSPEHYAIQHLVAHDYKGFFRAESEFRRTLNYPPFARLVNLRLDGPKAAEVETRARDFARKLNELQAATAKYREQVEVLGPAPAPIEKLRNRYRWQLLLRSKHSATLLNFTRQGRELLRPGANVRLHVDVDPYSML